MHCECTGTRAMAWHAKHVIMTRICTYLRSKTKSVMVGFVCSDGVSNVTLNVQLFDACDRTSVPNCSRVKRHIKKRDMNV